MNTFDLHKKNLWIAKLKYQISIFIFIKKTYLNCFFFWFLVNSNALDTNNYKKKPCTRKTRNLLTDTDRSTDIERNIQGFPSFFFRRVWFGRAGGLLFLAPPLATPLALLLTPIFILYLTNSWFNKNKTVQQKGKGGQGGIFLFFFLAQKFLGGGGGDSPLAAVAPPTAAGIGKKNA